VIAVAAVICETRFMRTINDLLGRIKNKKLVIPVESSQNGLRMLACDG